jgi:exopolysaccharide biosynthesis protein
VLVLDGRPIFNEKVFNDLDDNKQFIFQSRSPNKGEESLITFSDGMHNADRIGPSELYHASNPNPRSALLIDRDNNIKFVYVEGRDNRGDGMDLAQLAQLCIDCGAVKAINLDGGRSSQFMWKKPGETYIYEATPGYEAQAYPVGTVISFIKK